VLFTHTQAPGVDPLLICVMPGSEGLKFGLTLTLKNRVLYNLAYPTTGATGKIKK